MQTIGFIGLGRMGRPMAGNMQKKGFSLLAFDIVETPVQELVTLGAGAAASIAELAAACRTVITVLPSHVEVEKVILGEGGILANAAPGTLVMDMSTVDPASTDRVAAALGAAGMRFVDAPIGRLASHA
ncbi:MAG: NAD(P)-dependent oxidoreductase, partial [Lysobacterales bacterium]